MSEHACMCIHTHTHTCHWKVAHVHSIKCACVHKSHAPCLRHCKYFSHRVQSHGLIHMDKNHGFIMYRHEALLHRLIAAHCEHVQRTKYAPNISRRSGHAIALRRWHGAGFDIALTRSTPGHGRSPTASLMCFYLDSDCIITLKFDASQSKSVCTTLTIQVLSHI